jgi:hypothetical protein
MEVLVASVAYSVRSLCVCGNFYPNGINIGYARLGARNPVGTSFRFGLVQLPIRNGEFLLLFAALALAGSGEFSLKKWIEIKRESQFQKGLNDEKK